MRIAISNLAWEPRDDAQVAALLAGHRVDAIEIAVGKYFPDPREASECDIRRVGAEWARRGVEIVALQSLLFGAPNLNTFRSESDREALLARLAHVCRIAAGLGAGRLVFGSFRNRDKGELSARRATQIALPFFRRFGDICAGRGLTVCLEAVPARYGATFLTSTSEAASFVELVAHPAIKLHLDTGTMTVNGEDPTETVDAFAPLVGHIHASEPDLILFGEGGADHARVAHAVARTMPEAIVSLEMLLSETQPAVPSIEIGLTRAISMYRQ
jgi:D-psicose/D-tagatose/L-ribulose 3-epimerase